MSATNPNPDRAVATFPEALSTRQGWLEPFGWYREMRRKAPVRYDEERELWDVFRYQDVKRVLDDDEAFSSDPRNMPDFGREREERSPVLDTMLFADPPEHDRLRGVVDDFFRPSAVADLAPRIEEITGDLLDDAEGGEMDVVSDLAYPMPVVVIAELLGVPADDRDRFKDWSDTLVARPESRSREALAEVQREQERVGREMQEYFRVMIARRRDDPRADLISEIVHAEVDGHTLAEREMVGFCILLLIAGNITTTNLVTNAIRCFDERPETYDELRGDDERVRRAIEEVLRYQSPVQALFRIPTADVEISGRKIEAGEGIVAWLGSANRDGDRFENPDEFAPGRSPNQHLAFGHGTH